MDLEKTRKQIREVFPELTEREQKILILRYGEDNTCRTLEEVGKVFGVTRERIRQIENRALEKIRHYKNPSDEATDKSTKPLTEQ